MHPGWIARRNDIHFVWKYLSNDSPFNISMQSYAEKAASLGEDEMMVLFAPAIGKEFIKEIRDEEARPYVELLHEIKNKLGRRVIILADSDRDFRGAVVRENRKKIWRKICNLAEKRGYRFRENLTAEAYGELIDACVFCIAENMHEAAQLTEPVVIRPEITNHHFFRGTEYEARERLDELYYFRKREGEPNALFSESSRSVIRFR